MDSDAQLAQYFAGMWPHLDEHARRLVAASQAVELGYGGISRVSRACGLSRVTLTKGVEELQAAPLAAGRIRHEGGGRRALTSNDPGLAPALDGNACRPPPSWRTRPGASGAACNSSTPLVKVTRDRPQARLTREMPP